MTAAFDYSDLKTTADALIQRFGKAVVLTRQSRSADLDFWEQDQGPTASTDAQSISGLYGVRLNLETLSFTGDPGTLALSTPEHPLAKWVIQASTELPEPIGPEWELVAGGASYQVSSVEPVQPGSTLLLYFVMVNL